MRILLAIVLFFIQCGFLAEASAQSIVCRIIDNRSESNQPKYLDTLFAVKKIDFKFLSWKYDINYIFPRKTIDRKFSSEQFIVGEDITKPVSAYSYPRYTYVFDSLSRVVQYSYSGCVNCLSSPFDFKYEYDTLNRIIKIIELSFEEIIAARNKGAITREMVQARQRSDVTYEKDGSISSLKRSSNNKINFCISRIK